MIHGRIQFVSGRIFAGVFENLYSIFLPMRFLQLLLLLLGISCLSCKKETLSREEVFAIIERFDQAWRTKDAATVDKVLSPSYIYFTQSGGVVTRATVVQTASSPVYRLDSMQRKQFDIKIEGNTAIVNTVWSARGVYADRAFDDTQRCSVTVIKRNGLVQILSEHCALIK